MYGALHQEMKEVHPLIEFLAPEQERGLRQPAAAVLLKEHEEICQEDLLYQEFGQFCEYGQYFLRCYLFFEF